MVENIDDKYFSKYKGVGAADGYLSSIGTAKKNKGAAAGSGGSPDGELCMRLARRSHASHDRLPRRRQGSFPVARILLSVVSRAQCVFEI